VEQWLIVLDVSAPPRQVFSNDRGRLNLKGLISEGAEGAVADGVSANSTTSAFKINKLHGDFLARQNICQASIAK